MQTYEVSLILLNNSVLFQSAKHGIVICWKTMVSKPPLTRLEQSYLIMRLSKLFLLKLKSQRINKEVLLIRHLKQVY
jgi:hypothetical protein